MEDQAHTGETKCAKTLTRRTMEGTGDAHSWQTSIAIAACNLSREIGADGAIIVVDGMLHQDTAFTCKRLFRLLQ